VRDLTLQALSSSNNDQSRDALAVEIDNIKATLVGRPMGNT
jgi:flagellar hook-associated protein 3 FlgL